MRLSALLLASALAALATLGASSADAGERPRRERAEQVRPGRNDEAAKQAQRMNGGGRVLSVEPSEGGHRVKLLKNGEVRVLVVPLDPEEK